MVGKIGLGAYTPSSNWFNSISLSALQNRVAFEIAHTIRNKVIRFYSPWFSSGGNTVYEMIFQDVKMQSLAFVVRTSIIAKERKSWNFSGTLSSTNNKARNNFMAYAADRIYLNNQNTLWNGGFTTSVQLNQFFAQMSAVLSFNKSGLDNYGMAIPDLDRYNMNFFLMGYKLRMKSTSIKSAEVNIQCTNLLHSKENFFDRYLGLGVNLIF